MKYVSFVYYNSAVVTGGASTEELNCAETFQAMFVEKVKERSDAEESKEIVFEK